MHDEGVAGFGEVGGHAVAGVAEADVAYCFGGGGGCCGRHFFVVSDVVVLL